MQEPRYYQLENVIFIVVFCLIFLSFDCCLNYQRTNFSILDSSFHDFDHCIIGPQKFFVFLYEKVNLH
jgi:hypothetical protein